MDEKIAAKIKAAEEEAKKYGFTTFSHSGDWSQITLTNEDGITLDINLKNSTASIGFMHKLFFIEARDFGWPHLKFEQYFLNPARAMKQKLESD